jgi:hypothetical protein
VNVIEVLAAVHSTAALLNLIGWLIVIACIIAAGVAAWTDRWLAVALLVVVAIVAAALLL